MSYDRKLKQFVKFLCEKYEKDDILKSYGKTTWILVRESGVDLGDSRAQLAVMTVLLHVGMIEAVDLTGVRKENARQVHSYTKIRPSSKGLNSNQADWTKIVSALAEGITSGVIKGLKG